MFGIGKINTQHIFSLHATATAESLPDELLSGIISPALGTRRHSSSEVLLVCKAWLRVAPPLLYNVVVIRSTAQEAKVEVGFGGHILKSAPNVTDIFISTAIHSPDTTPGPIIDLSWLNPQRLILFEDTTQNLETKGVMQLFQALADAMDKKWTNLRLGLPYLHCYPAFWQNTKIERFGECLRSNPLERTFAKFTDTMPRSVMLTADTGHVPLDWDAFEALAKTSGETLVEMSRYSVKSSDFRIPRQPTIFLHFTTLRSLNVIQVSASPAVCPDSSPLLSPPSSHLTSSRAVYSPRSNNSSLPMLRRFVLDGSIKAPAYDAFLTRHRHKLTDISLSNRSIQKASTIFKHCPALLNLDLRLVGAHGLTCPPKHHSLVKMVVQKAPSAGRNVRDDHAEWTKFWADSAWGDFPALRRIEVAPLEWPTNERAISKSPWLVDWEGIHWRPNFRALAVKTRHPYRGRAQTNFLFILIESHLQAYASQVGRGAFLPRSFTIGPAISGVPTVYKYDPVSRTFPHEPPRI
ncbi:hypothetical protein DFH08DRAFT_1008689 [Mycena albidolilacea]|uniref:Uncharacterized protein n=1 Tax=Mycena albidolilacea TaxID=1033008 RepID=A0AAD6ZXY2_9AGAR|nr:hypothetical protein DFH08DRAFT_1008689 [Mycena albidolilacea]